MLEAATISVQTSWVRPERSRDVSPPRQLMAAVLRTAVDDCLNSFYPPSAGYGTLAARRRSHDARLYVLNKDRAWPFSFENLCDALDLDARKLRRWLLSAPHHPAHRVSIGGGVPSDGGLKFEGVLQ